MCPKDAIHFTNLSCLPPYDDCNDYNYNNNNYTTDNNNNNNMSDSTTAKLPTELPLDEKAPSYEEATLEEAPSKQLSNVDEEAQTEQPPKRKCRKALWIVLGLLFLSPVIGMSIDACNEMMEREGHGPGHHGKHGKHHGPHGPHHGGPGNPDNQMMPAGNRHGKHHGMRPHGGMMRPGMMPGMPCDEDKQQMQTVRVHYILPNGEHKVAEIHGGRFFPGRVQPQIEAKPEEEADKVEEVHSDSDSDSDSDDDSDDDSDSDDEDETAEETIQVAPAPVPQVE